MGQIDLNNYEAYLLDYFEGNLSEEMLVELKSFVREHPELEIDLTDTVFPVVEKERLEVDFKDDLLKKDSDVPNADLLDYLEGNLEGFDKVAFELKLSQDAELQRELAAFRKTFLQPSPAHVFDFKDSLSKTEDELLLSNRVISYFENELGLTERRAFEAELKTHEALRKELSLVQETRLIADTAVVYPSKELLLKEVKVVVLFSYRAAMAAAVLLVFGLAVFFMINNKDGKELEGNKLAFNAVFKKGQRARRSLHSPLNVNNNASVVAAHKKRSRYEINNQGQQETNIAVNNSTLNAVQVMTVSTTATANVNESLPALATNSVNNASETSGGEPVIRYTNINALSVSADNEETVAVAEKPKKGFWKRAVSIARQVNGLGVKAVKGEEKENESYSLSFNSFSVVKK